MLSRRMFVLGGVTTTLASKASLALPGSGAGEYSRAHFESLVSSRFVAENETGAMRLELLAVCDEDCAPELDQFWLTFRADDDLPAGLFRVRSVRDRSFDGHLYIEPGERAEIGQLFTASFSRLPGY